MLPPAIYQAHVKSYNKHSLAGLYVFRLAQRTRALHCPITLFYRGEESSTQIRGYTLEQILNNKTKDTCKQTTTYSRALSQTWLMTVLEDNSIERTVQMIW